MLTKYCLVLTILLCGAACDQASSSSCKDVDTHSCQTFFMSKPDICNETSFSQSLCKRFCGNCPLECFSCPTAVRNPKDCTSTSQCGPHMNCMLKNFLAPDGHHEYIMSCERKDICDSLTTGFGKRDSNGAKRSQSRRDVTFSCCDSDLCNFAPPTTATTTTPIFTFPPIVTTTSTLVVTTQPSTATCFRDIVFVLDASGSEGLSNFNTMLDFVGMIVSQINVGPNNAHVALMTFDSRTYIQWHLNRYGTANELLAALSQVRYTSGTTHTAEALEAVGTQILTAASGDRLGAENAVIVVTDGQSNNPAATRAMAAKLHAISKDVVAIGVGSGTKPTELNGIATDSNHVFDVHGFHDLSPLVPSVKNIICS